MRISDWSSDVCSSDLWSRLRAAPVQRPGGLVVAVLEEVGADRLRQGGIVDHQRNVVAGLFADLLPARADLRAVFGPVKDAIGGRVFRVRWFGGNDGQLAVKGEIGRAPG